VSREGKPATLRELAGSWRRVGLVVLVAGAFVLAGMAAEQLLPRPDLALVTTNVPPLPHVEPAVISVASVGLPEDAHLERTPPRQTKGLDLVKLGWTYNCMECHKMLPARWHYDRPMVEHRTITLDHGNNRFCLNCHHATNRNAFVDYDGSEIAEADVVLLCAKCHGPIYRDWQAGVHGRRNGYWNQAKGARTQLRCIQCHDPHQPKFQSMKPLAPLQYPARAAGAVPHAGAVGEHQSH
jgi:hypothetical protein